jgi:hypothetical protein
LINKVLNSQKKKKKKATGAEAGYTRVANHGTLLHYGGPSR